MCKQEEYIRHCWVSPVNLPTWPCHCIAFWSIIWSVLRHVQQWLMNRACMRWYCCTATCHLNQPSCFSILKSSGASSTGPPWQQTTPMLDFCRKQAGITRTCWANWHSKKLLSSMIKADLHTLIMHVHMPWESRSQLGYPECDQKLALCMALLKLCHAALSAITWLVKLVWINTMACSCGVRKMCMLPCCARFSCIALTPLAGTSKFFSTSGEASRLWDLSRVICCLPVVLRQIARYMTKVYSCKTTRAIVKIIPTQYSAESSDVWLMSPKFSTNKPISKMIWTKRVVP